MAATFNLEYDEKLILLLFTDVSNFEQIKTYLTDSTPPFTNCTIINPKLILDAFQIVVAANKSVISRHSKNSVTESLSKGLLFHLSISDNITASLQKFGYSSDNDNLLLLAFFEKDPRIIEDIKLKVKGVLQPLNKLSDFSNIDVIKQTYAIENEHLRATSLLDLIVTKIACK